MLFIFYHIDIAVLIWFCFSFLFMLTWQQLPRWMVSVTLLTDSRNLHSTPLDTHCFSWLSVSCWTHSWAFTAHASKTTLNALRGWGEKSLEQAERDFCQFFLMVGLRQMIYNLSVVTIILIFKKKKIKVCVHHH